ncbi:MAG: C40 family peptidase [Treponema sp.]|nr:C40 family peptidase [Treponema sp.]
MAMIKDKSVIIFIILAFFLMSIPRVCAQNAQSTQTASMSAGEAAITRQKMVDYSKKYVGCPYVLGATGPESFDCSGFVFSVSRESIGVQLPRTTKAIYKFCKDIDDSAREAGDLVFFKTTSSGEVSHVGIYMGNSQFIHCVSDGPNTGVIVSSLKESYWKSKYLCTKRYLPSSNSELLADSSKSNDLKSQDSESKDSDSEKKTSSASGSSSQRNSSSSKSSSSKFAGNGFLRKLVADASINLDWNFFTPDYFRLTWRGLDAMAHVRYEGKNFRPGVGTYIRYDAGTENLQIPFIFSLTLSDYVRAFAGPVFSIGKPTLPGNSDEKIKNSFFPGILGICWNTPSIKAGKTEISFVQDIHYTVFNKNDSSALSPRKSIPSGLVFATGVRVTLPLKNLL